MTTPSLLKTSSRILGQQQRDQNGRHCEESLYPNGGNFNGANTYALFSSHSRAPDQSTRKAPYFFVDFSAG